MGFLENMNSQTFARLRTAGEQTKGRRREWSLSYGGAVIMDRFVRLLWTNNCNRCSVRFAKLLSCLFFLGATWGGQGDIQAEGFGNEPCSIIPGAARTEIYLPDLHGKRVAFAGNHTSMINNVHLVDTLLAAGINVVKIFSPEHGFRGEAAAGEWVESEIDPITGIPIVSLYGRSRRPTPDQLRDVDVVVFDMQDVGVRFYTYISAMTYIMEEVARHQLKMIVLDRPNPLIHYIDGPILESKYRSFVGLHPVPVVYGMTIGEYALMVNGEGWLGDKLFCNLKVIPVGNYSRACRYQLPIPPSPNLPNMRAIYLYPSLCFFEGTEVSLGRGTPYPFQVFGHPSFNPVQFPFSFTPQSVRAAPNPPQLGKLCHGVDLRNIPEKQLQQNTHIQLGYLLDAYRAFPREKEFFNNFFERLSGTASLREQVIAGWSEQQIRVGWQDGLDAFEKIRTPYLLYP